jgi:hypothetical protein
MCRLMRPVDIAMPPDLACDQFPGSNQEGKVKDLLVKSPTGESLTPHILCID